MDEASLCAGTMIETNRRAAAAAPLGAGGVEGPGRHALRQRQRLEAQDHRELERRAAAPQRIGNPRPPAPAQRRGRRRRRAPGARRVRAAGGPQPADDVASDKDVEVRAARQRGGGGATAWLGLEVVEQRFSSLCRQAIREQISQVRKREEARCAHMAMRPRQLRREEMRCTHVAMARRRRSWPWP